MPTTLRASSEMVGSWWRCSGYEIREGYLRPARHASLETYDPWIENERLRQGGEQTAHESLANLLGRLFAGSPFSLETMSSMMAMAPQSKLSPSAEEAIVGWTKRFGLLGIGLDGHLAVTLPAVWSRDPARRYPGMYCATSTSHRTATGWVTEVELHEAVPQHAKELQRVPSDQIPKAARRHVPSVTLASGAHGNFGSDWATFFPDLDPEHEAFPYPPHARDDRFWKSYAEPVDRWLRTAWSLWYLLSRRGAPSPEDLTCWNQELLSCGQRLVVDDHGGTSLAPCAPSLSSALALMAIRDVATGEIHRCTAPSCTALFFAKRSDRVFCSDLCRNRKTQQDYRDRQHDARKRKAAPSAKRGRR